MVIDKVVTEYNQKGFTVIKKLIEPQDVTKFVGIAKHYDSGTTTNENITYR